MGIQKNIFLFILLMISSSVVLVAQSDTKSDKKVVIITKTKDADGKEIVKKVVKEGEEINDEEIEKMINMELDDEGVKMKKGAVVNKEIEEEVTIDENGKKTTTKRIKMKINDEDIEMGDKEEHVIIKKDGKQQEMTKVQEFEIITDGNDDEVIELGSGMELKIKGSKDKAGEKKPTKKKIKVIIEEEQ